MTASTPIFNPSITLALLRLKYACIKHERIWQKLADWFGLLTILSGLPAEIIEMVFLALESPTALFIISVMYPGLKEHAERILFKSLSVIMYSPDGWIRPLALVAIADVLRQSKESALTTTATVAAARRCRLSVSAGSDSLLAAILRTLTNLRQLTLKDMLIEEPSKSSKSSDLSEPLPPSRAESCLVSSLETLTVSRVRVPKPVSSCPLDIFDINDTLVDDQSDPVFFTSTKRRSLDIRCLKVTHYLDSFPLFGDSVTFTRISALYFKILGITDEMATVATRRTGRRTGPLGYRTASTHRHGNMDAFLRLHGHTLVTLMLNVSSLLDFGNIMDPDDNNWTIYRLSNVCSSLRVLHIVFQLDVFSTSGPSLFEPTLHQVVLAIGWTERSAPADYNHGRSRADRCQESDRSVAELWKELSAKLDEVALPELQSVKFVTHLSDNTAGRWEQVHLCQVYLRSAFPGLARSGMMEFE
ncbi:hypothetical protein EIP91_001961 [Steccherinum ochraceum]|uniref:Uncharacterized protein n=1 Tax=Steccherinum ochraceum TaxID=92696 RepID=A0A4R0RLH1_9APHY|nr:hypothetical protein EIP91_001961 [Steccherinum ochraceum]